MPTTDSPKWMSRNRDDLLHDVQTDDDDDVVLQTVTDILTTFETKQNHMNVARSAVDHTPTGSDTPLQYTYYL